MYPGSDYNYQMMEELRAISLEAKSHGLATVVWSYPRGGMITKAGETALDIVAYAAHMAALMGANIIKVKPPIDAIDLEAAKKVYETQAIPRATLQERIQHVMQAKLRRTQAGGVFGRREQGRRFAGRRDQADQGRRWLRLDRRPQRLPVSKAGRPGAAEPDRRRLSRRRLSLGSPRLAG